MLNLCGIVVAILIMATGRNFSMSGINSGHHNLPTYEMAVQSGHHNTANIQHCLISSKFDMWVDNDVPNWFPTLKNVYRSPFSKWPPQYRLGNWTMLNFCSIVITILKMATGRNFSMSGINSGHHNLPTYEMALKSDNVELVRYCGGHWYHQNLIWG
jgi:5-carboxymethyl-2-hydroxymuconate isomerase